MTFFMAQMRAAHAEHGNALVWVNEGGECSANPADYWQYSETDPLPGYLAIRKPERLFPLPDAIEEPRRKARQSEDARLECWFDGEPSVALAPRHTGGDVDRPAHWVPVCERHMEQWHNEVDAGERLPIIPRNGVALSVEQADALIARLALLEESGILDDEDRDALDALETGVRALHNYGLES